MKDIHEVLRQKQTKYAQLGKQIEMLQQAAEKLREVAPLLAENEDDDNSVLMEVDDASPNSEAAAAKAGAGSSGSSAKAARPTAPRWP
jgi:indole-3-glycerol phosphate synthase